MSTLLVATSRIDVRKRLIQGNLSSLSERGFLSVSLKGVSMDWICCSEPGCMDAVLGSVTIGDAGYCDFHLNDHRRADAAELWLMDAQKKSDARAALVIEKYRRTH